MEMKAGALLTQYFFVDEYQHGRCGEKSLLYMYSCQLCPGVCKRGRAESLAALLARCKLHIYLNHHARYAEFERVLLARQGRPLLQAKRR